MLKKLITTLVFAMLLLPGIVAAMPIVQWHETARPLSVSGVPGDKVEMKGKICVPSSSPEPFTGKLHYSIWGVGSSQCAVVCNNCYDYEAFGGSYGGDVCITGAFPLGTNTKCGDVPNCIGTTQCGVDCSTNMDTQYSPTFTVSVGSCSQEYTFTTDIDNTWTKGWYTANLDTLWNGRNLDIEYAPFEVGGIPVVNVVMVAFTIIAFGALAAVIWFIKR